MMQCPWSGSVLYWILGFSLMYGAGSAWLGWQGFFFIGTDPNVPTECTFIFPQSSIHLA